MGLKAPPALAAIITKPNRNHFDFVFSTILLIIATITMAVVRLSRNADKQKVRIEIAHTNRFLGINDKALVIGKNPP